MKTFWETFQEGAEWGKVVCTNHLIFLFRRDRQPRKIFVDEVHESARWLCSLFLFHLLSLGSSDRNHNDIYRIGPYSLR